MSAETRATARSLLVGVIGHVDHGKTALVGALTGIQTDRLEEEKARGVSIVPGFALMQVNGSTGAGSSEIDFVDLPGHERFVRSMISGATGMRAVLLAVDANEGIKPQTLEHLEIARLIGVRRGVVALTRSDLAAAETIGSRMAEVSAVVARFGFETSAVVATSTVTGTGLSELTAALGALLQHTPPAGDDGFPYLPIDRVFARPGFGSVVTGTLRRGCLSVGDRVEIMPGNAVATVRSLQIHGRSVQTIEPGRRTAVALRGVELADLHRGQALTAPGLLAPSRWIDVSVKAVANIAANLEGGMVCRLMFGTTELIARLRLLDCDTLEPGQTALAQLRTEADIVVPAREPFILRLDSPSVTVAGGKVIDPVSRRWKRRDPQVLAELGVLVSAKPKEMLGTRLAREGTTGAELLDLARLVGTAPDRARRALAEIGAREIGDVYIGAPAFTALREELLAVLAQHHRDHPIEHGMPLDRIARAVARSEIVVANALRDLVATRDAVQAGPHFRRADFDPSQQETEHVRALEAAYRKAALSPPDEIAAVGRDIRRREALNYLLASGTLIRALDRVQKRTILFHKDAIATSKQQLTDAFPQATASATGFLAKEAGAVLGISRKFSIPLLEHLDATRFTRRVGDRRVFVDAASAPG